MDKFKKAVINMLAFLSAGVMLAGISCSNGNFGNGSEENSRGGQHSSAFDDGSSSQDEPTDVSVNTGSGVETEKEMSSIPYAEAIDRTPTDSLQYELSENGNYYIVTGYYDEELEHEDGEEGGNAKQIVIPESYEGKPVKEIRSRAFQLVDIDALIIPDSISIIGGDIFGPAFAVNGPSLFWMELGSGITEIADGAFANTPCLREVYNKSSINITAESNIFMNMGMYTSYVKNIYTPNSGESKVFVEENGIVWYKEPDLSVLIAYVGKPTEIVVPSYITKILGGAFAYCNSLTSVIISDSVTEIGESVFEGCTMLKEVVLSKNISAIKSRTFRECVSLTSVIIPSSVTEIGENAFSSCKSLTTIIIPDSVTKIGECAFEGCTMLKEVVLSKNISAIKSRTFSGCVSLTSVVIPDSVTEIGNGAFGGCELLTSITIPDSVTEIGKSAFERCTMLKEVILSKNISAIKSRTFSGCVSLTSVVIPDSVTEIESLAFFACELLTSIIIPDSVTEIGENAFYKCDTIVLYYKGTDKQWAEIYNGPVTNITFYSETEPTGEGNFWHYVDGEPKVWKKGTV